MKGRITEVSEVPGYQGQGTDKKCRVLLEDGTFSTVYVKEVAKKIFQDVKSGADVLLMEKSNGNGYLIKTVMPVAGGVAPAAAAPASKALLSMEGEELQGAVEKAVNIWLMAYKAAYVATKKNEALSTQAANAAVKLLGA